MQRGETRRGRRDQMGNGKDWATREGRETESESGVVRDVRPMLRYGTVRHGLASVGARGEKLCAGKAWHGMHDEVCSLTPDRLAGGRWHVACRLSQLAARSGGWDR